MLSPEERELLGRQAERRRVAGQLIDDLELLERWNAHGQPEMCGALAYELLVGPDVDLDLSDRRPSWPARL